MKSMAKKQNSKDKQECPDSMSSGGLPQQTSKKQKSTLSSLPALPLPDKKIHPRQYIPPVSDGKKVSDKTPTPPVDPD